MKKALLMIGLFMVAVLNAAQAKLLEGVSRPSVFIVRGDRIYTLEEATVSIYSLKDLSLVKRFGKAGEGPGEFKYNGNFGRPLSMAFQGDKLAVNSMNRMTYFSLDGEYTGEENLKIDMLLFSIKDKYIGVGPTRSDDGKTQGIGFRLYDSRFTPGKLVYLSKLDVENPSELVIPADTFTYNPVYGDRIYVNTSSEKFIIDVFDADGVKLYAIEKDYPSIPLGDEYRKLTHEFFRTSPRFKREYEYIKNVLKFRDHLPPIRDLYLEEGRIHVITYNRRGNEWEMIVLDLKGNEIGRTFIPLAEYEPFSFYPILYSVCRDKVYSLVETDDDEGWVVQSTPLQLK